MEIRFLNPVAETVRGLFRKHARERAGGAPVAASQ